MDTMALFGEGVQKVQEYPGILAHRSGNVRKHDQLADDRAAARESAQDEVPRTAMASRMVERGSIRTGRWDRR